MIRIWDQVFELMSNFCLRHSSRFPIRFLLSVVIVMSLIRRSRRGKSWCSKLKSRWSWTNAKMLVLEFESHGAEIHEKRKDQDMARLQKKLEASLFYLREANLSKLSDYWCIFSDKKRQESAGMSNLNQRPHGCPLVSPIQMVARSTIHTVGKISTTLTVPSSCSQYFILNLCSSSNWHLVVKEALKGDVGKGGWVDQRAHAVTYLSSCIIVWWRLRLFILMKISTETKTTKLPIMSEIWL